MRRYVDLACLAVAVVLVAISARAVLHSRAPAPERRASPSPAPAEPTPSAHTERPVGTVLQGSVMDEDAHQPVSNWTVFLYHEVRRGESEEEGRTRTSSDGSFQFDRLVAGDSYSVAPASNDHEIPDSEAKGISFMAGVQVEIVLHIQEAGTVDAQVTNLDGSPAGRGVQVSDFLSGDPNQNAQRPGSPDAAGHYSVSLHIGSYLIGAFDLPGARHRIWYYPGTWDRAQALPVVVSFRETTRVDLRLPR